MQRVEHYLLLLDSKPSPPPIRFQAYPVVRPAGPFAVSSASYEGHGTFRPPMSQPDQQSRAQERTAEQSAPTEAAIASPAPTVTSNARVRRWGPDGDSLKSVEKAEKPAQQMQPSATPLTSIAAQDAPPEPPKPADAAPSRDAVRDAESERKRELAAALFGGK